MSSSCIFAHIDRGLVGDVQLHHRESVGVSHPQLLQFSCAIRVPARGHHTAAALLRTYKEQLIACRMEERSGNLVLSETSDIVEGMGRSVTLGV